MKLFAFNRTRQRIIEIDAEIVALKERLRHLERWKVHAVQEHYKYGLFSYKSMRKIIERKRSRENAI